MKTETTRVVHVRDNIEGAVYIGRANGRARLSGSVWKNPFRVSEDLRTSDVVELYEVHMSKGLGRHLLRQLPELRGKPLACWCRHDGKERTPDNACHGDVLVQLLAMYTDDELRAMGDDR